MEKGDINKLINSMSHRAPDENGVIIIKIFQLVWED